MRAVVQRVIRAAVTVDRRTVGRIEAGVLVLLGVAAEDKERDAQTMAEKLANLRIFSDPAGLMNLSIKDTGGAILLVSQFTLHGDARKGRRPSFITAAREDIARPLYELTGRLLERDGLAVEYGEFGADMAVELLNDGPVTILLDTQKVF
ncbi:MAG: D-aminoacyl-tRNA deacylase [Candidatus Baltobacteraceae bacterium]